MFVKIFLTDLEIWKKGHYLCDSSYNISYQERLREMARRSLDNLLKFACCKWKVRCQLHPDGYIGTDKSDPGLTIVVIRF